VLQTSQEWLSRLGSGSDIFQRDVHPSAQFSINRGRFEQSALNSDGGALDILLKLQSALGGLETADLSSVQDGSFGSL